MSQRQSTSRQRSGAAVGWITFAAIMLIMIGIFHALAGLAGIIEDEFYRIAPAAGTEAAGDAYFLQFDATTWGWIHLSAASSSYSPASRCSEARSGLGPSA